MREHLRTGDPRHCGWSTPKTEPKSPNPAAEQRVTQGMHGHVAVGMPRAAVGVVEQQPQQPARTAALDRMDVGADADAGQAHAVSTVCASRRSSGVVILKANGSPGTVCTGVPRFSTREASSVTEAVPARW